LFVELDKDIHGLAHISQLNLAPGQKIYELFKAGEEKEFTVVSVEPKEHRLGLSFGDQKEEKQEKEKPAKAKKETEAKKDKKAEIAEPKEAIKKTAEKAAKKTKADEKKAKEEK
jgi:predicted RNA-binding protein with RPS1 domain